jgi:hypothetical protein
MAELVNERRGSLRDLWGLRQVSTITKTMRVERPLEDLAELLGARPPEWLIPFASIAVHTAEAAAVRRSGVARRPRARSRRITIDLEDVPQNDEVSRVDVGVRWETRGFALVFASFEGRIIATRTNDVACVVTLDGVYTPPRGRSSRQDQVAVASAAEAAIEKLLSTLRDAVEEQARASI